MPAEFFGFEIEGSKKLNANYSADIWGDYVRANNKDGGNLPRIPAMRLGAGLYYQWNRFNYRQDLRHQ